jgi:uncharacterized membrane protein (UPF0127 family)
MLFLFPNDQTSCFWMSNTPVALDIAFISSSGTVTAVLPGTPFSTALICPPGPYRNALEVNQGWFADHGLGVGALVELLP